MKINYLLFLFMVSASCFAQRQYDFNYLIEYELISYKDSVNENSITRYYLTNSKKNNYLAVITHLDSLNYLMDFKDENGLSFNVEFRKSELNKAEFINVDCKYVRRYNNPYKALINDYEFVNLKDTLIDHILYPQYKLSSIKPKKKKRKKLGTEFYIIFNETNFHLPILYFPTAYQEWKSEKNIPNGIFKERYLIDYNGKIILREKFVNSWNTTKKIILNKDCDYSEEK